MDIRNAYRRLSLLFHPDKHLEDSKKTAAQLLFSRINRAYAGIVFGLVLIILCSPVGRKTTLHLR